MAPLTSVSPGSSSLSSEPLHFVLIPFMSKGHIIPQIHLARLLFRRNLSVTIFNTPSNCKFIRQSLLDTSVVIKELAFPGNIPGIPSGVESTEDFPCFSQSLFTIFASSTKSMQASFEQTLETLSSPVNCIVYDWFLYWVQESADKLGIPALNFNATSNYVNVLYYLARTEENAYCDLLDEQELFSFPSFPSVKFTINDFSKRIISIKPHKKDYLDKAVVDDQKPPDDKEIDFIMRVGAAGLKSQGLLVNSFYELEPMFVDYWNTHCVPRAWCIGPLCLAAPKQDTNYGQQMMRPWLEWLDQKLTGGERVVYVSFGSQAYISPEQLREIAKGLEESSQCFLWVLKKSMVENLGEEFQKKVKGRGLILSQWVDQVEILEHGSIFGFLSHCGWNSVIEAICAGKPILAMPMIAEQHLNAKILVDEFGIGLRIPTIDESVRSTDVKAMVRELMVGDAGNRVRNKMKEVSEAAHVAMKDGGSSWCTMNQLIEAVQLGKL